MKVKGKIKTQSIIEYVLVIAVILAAMIVGARRIRGSVATAMNDAAVVVDEITKRGY